MSAPTLKMAVVVLATALLLVPAAAAGENGEANRSTDNCRDGCKDKSTSSAETTEPSSSSEPSDDASSSAASSDAESDDSSSSTPSDGSDGATSDDGGPETITLPDADPAATVDSVGDDFYKISGCEPVDLVSNNPTVSVDPLLGMVVLSPDDCLPPEFQSLL